MNGRRLAHAAGDHGTRDLRRGHEGARRHVHHDARIRMILHGNGECAVVLRSGTRSHANSDLLLHHGHHALDGQMLFEECHEDRGGDVVGKIRNDFEPLSRTEVQDAEDVQLQDVARHDGHVVIALQCLGENGREFFIQLDGDDARTALREPLRQRADAGANLEDSICRAEVSRIHDGAHHARIHEEVLPEPLARAQVKGAQDVARDLGVGDHGDTCVHSMSSHAAVNSARVMP